MANKVPIFSGKSNVLNIFAIATFLQTPTVVEVCGFQRRLSVCLPVCLFYRIIISQNRCSYRTTIPDKKCSTMSVETHLFWGIKSKVKVTRHKNSAGVGFALL